MHQFRQHFRVPGKPKSDVIEFRIYGRSSGIHFRDGHKIRATASLKYQFAEKLKTPIRERATLKRLDSKYELGRNSAEFRGRVAG